MCTLKERLIQQVGLASLHSKFRKYCPSERKSLDVQETRWKIRPNDVVRLDSMSLKSLRVRRLGCIVLAH